jgi:hypothetical protein
MREHPWHLRRASAEHHHWYRNLTDLHALTTAWLNDLNVPRSPNALRRGLDDDLAETLWLLEGMSAETETPGPRLDSILDDTRPEDLLSRLERTIWLVQAWTLIGITDKVEKTAGTEDRDSLLNQLEQSSWRAGRLCATRRWPNLDPEARGDLRGIFAALRDSPLSGSAQRPAWLVRRRLPAELQLELLDCPHRGRFPEIAPVADRLCELHAHWLRGFAYALNSRISIHATPSAPDEPRCRQLWQLASLHA